MGYIFLVFIIYLLYRFITEFVVPIARSTSAMRQKVQEMQGQGNTARHNGFAQENNSGGTAYRQQNDTNAQPKEGEYIDFEEIK